MKPILVERYDTISLAGGQLERTPQGGFRARARFTRSGVLPYKLPDGSVRREWRPPEEVFRPESLAMLHDAPVTVHHPEVGRVTPENYRKVTVGHVRNDVAPEEDTYVAGTVVIQDAQTVDESLVRDLSDISSGYQSRLELTSGVVPDGMPDAGQPYDAIQRDIKYNHVALLPRGKGRAGPDVSLRLDSNGHQVAPFPEEVSTMDLTPEEIEGLKSLAQAVPTLMKLAAGNAAPAAAPAEPVTPPAPKVDEEPPAPKAEEKAPAVTPPAGEKMGDEEQKTDSQEPKTKADDGPKPLSPEEQERLVQDSIEIREQARSVLGKDHDLKGKDNRQVMTEAILHVDDKYTVAGKAPAKLGDEALRVAFEDSVSRFVERTDSKDELGKARRATVRLDAKDSAPSGVNATLTKKSRAAYEA